MIEDDYYGSSDLDNEYYDQDPYSELGYLKLNEEEELDFLDEYSLLEEFEEDNSEPDDIFRIDPTERLEN